MNDNLKADLDVSISVKAASTLAWVLGVLDAIGALSVGAIMVSKGGPLVVPMVQLIKAAVLCFMGYGLRKGRKSTAKLSVAIAVLFVIGIFLSRYLVSIWEIAITFIVAMLVIKTWKEFR